MPPLEMCPVRSSLGVFKSIFLVLGKNKIDSLLLAVTSAAHAYLMKEEAAMLSQLAPSFCINSLRLETVQLTRNSTRKLT